MSDDDIQMINRVFGNPLNEGDKLKSKTLSVNHLVPLIHRRMKKDSNLESKTYCYVVNTETSSQKGFHWIFVEWSVSATGGYINVSDSYGHGCHSKSLHNLLKITFPQAIVTLRLLGVQNDDDGMSCGYICSWLLIHANNSFGSRPQLVSRTCFELALWMPVVQKVLQAYEIITAKGVSEVEAAAAYRQHLPFFLLSQLGNRKNTAHKIQKLLNEANIRLNDNVHPRAHT
jgi:hypothetical protein